MGVLSTYAAAKADGKKVKRHPEVTAKQFVLAGLAIFFVRSVEVAGCPDRAGRFLALAALRSDPGEAATKSGRRVSTL